MSSILECDFEERRKLLKESNKANTTNINGIDYLEVIPPTTMLETPLLVVFCLLPIPNTLGPQNVSITGGTRIKNIGVTWALTANSPSLAGLIGQDQTNEMNDELKESGVLDLSTILVVRPSSDGDFSAYTLQFVDSAEASRPPAGFDSIISKTEFGFKVECPSDFDCLSAKVCPPVQLQEPTIDYMSKDYESFRTLMLNRLSILIPDWKERHSADMGVAVVELLAYVGDQLSYYQDAVATEAYLGTARQRVSIRRHGRLLDYRVHDGCNARAWIVMEVNSPPSGVVIPEGTMLLTGGPGDPMIVKQSELDDALANAEAFQTMTKATFFTNKNEILFYSWGDPECCLPAGATGATLDNNHPVPHALDVRVFDWSNVPGTDSAALQNYLANQYGIDWPIDAATQVRKTPDNKQVLLLNGFNSATITLSEDNSVGVAVIDGKSVDEFVMLDDVNAPPKPATMSAYAHTVRIGDVLVFEETHSPTNGSRADADPNHRFAVRLTKISAVKDPLGNIATGGEAAIESDANSTVAPNELLKVEWDPLDALPFALCLKQVIDSDSGQPAPVSVARGNVVLADHGYVKLNGTFPYQFVPPLTPQYNVKDANGITQFSEFLGFTPVKGIFRPRLEYGPATHASIPNPAQAATSAFNFGPRDAVPDILLLGEKQVWHPVQDLLASTQLSHEFVAENDNSGGPLLRFGDDDYGQTPRPSIDQPGAEDYNPFFALYRVGNGSQGNVGREAISRVLDVPGAHATPKGFPQWAILKPLNSSAIQKIRNPMEARGGLNPESLEDVEQFAPEAFRTQKRAVTASDYETLLLEYPQVKKAYARLKWTGSWLTYFISVDRAGGAPIDPPFRQKILDFLDGYRLAGYDLEITNPTYAPLQISMHVCVSPGFSPSSVKAALFDSFSNKLLPDGTTGFFYPDNFTFGQPVYLSQVYNRALKVPGVDSIEVDTFQRWGRNPENEIQKGVLQVAVSEIARLDNDPNFPENGRIDFVVDGGAQ